MKRKPTFDVVVDGLNVANVNKDKNRQSETVQTCKAAYQMKRIHSEERLHLNFGGFAPSACLFHLGGEFSVSCRMTNAAAHMSRSA